MRRLSLICLLFMLPLTLAACAQRENIVVDTVLYGGFEQTGSLPQDFSGNDVQITAEPGDMVLYSGN